MEKKPGRDESHWDSKPESPTSTCQVEEELQEQDFLDRCFQEMLDEEDQDWFIPSRDLPQVMGQLQQQLSGLSVSDGHDSEDILVRFIYSSTYDIVKRIWDLES